MESINIYGQGSIFILLTYNQYEHMEYNEVKVVLWSTIHFVHVSSKYENMIHLTTVVMH